jgi:transcriptional regulator with XRE-family HTH domain
MVFKRIRQQNGISLRALATRAEMSYTYLCNVENGKADPSLSTLRKVAKALGVTLIDLLSDDEEPRLAKEKAERKTKPSPFKKKGR